MKAAQLVISLSLALILISLASSANAADSAGEPILIDHVYDSPLSDSKTHSPEPYPAEYLAYLQKLLEYKLTAYASAPKSQDAASFKLYFLSKPRNNAPLTYSYLQQIEFSSDQSVNDFYKKLVISAFPVKPPPDRRYAFAGIVITFINGNVKVDMFKEFQQGFQKSPVQFPIRSKPILFGP